jgi:nucleoside 2-deoxyribosyltransferase
MKIYLAGPDVFRPDTARHFADARALLARHGHQALVPLDNEATTAAGIFAANMALLAAADALLANLNPFRGCEPDSGTCFEVGCAVALGKRVVGYVADGRAQRDKLAALAGHPLRQVDGRPVDADGLFVEDFALPLNLMLGLACEIVEGDLEQAVLTLGPA